jgi:hypothetical protein
MYALSAQAANAEMRASCGGSSSDNCFLLNDEEEATEVGRGKVAEGPWRS